MTIKTYIVTTTEAAFCFGFRFYLFFFCQLVSVLNGQLGLYGLELTAGDGVKYTLQHYAMK